MMTRKVLRYTIGDFLHDLDREFHFLEKLGYKEDSSTWTSHETAAPSGTLFGESVFSAAPIVKYRGPGGRVTVAHDPRGEVQVSVVSLDGRSFDIQEIVAKQDIRAAQRYGGIYDATSETAGAVLARLGEGLRQYGVSLLSEPRS
jgi:hypothetical protein